ncbi:MAG: hypothetical protein BroJett040_15640 [Oligoflexia bacterium]|nr:MAG: hypothetical protein BroJett040_15640 [Oligoflexia bacterium]
MLKKAVLTLFATLTLLTGQPAKAYDIDTHFYATSMMLIWGGIKPDVAFELATYAQWIDESKWSTPMDFEPVFGTRKRRLFHFPSNFYSEKLELGDMNRIYEILNVKGETDLTLNYNDSNHSVNYGWMDGVRPNNPFAYELIMIGMKRGNKMLVGAGLHVLMDSFGHSDFPAILGHASAGHVPDRPYLYVEKYKDMTRSVFKVITMLRKLLPPEALNPQFKSANSTKSHLDMTADELVESFWQNEKIERAITRDILRSPEYTKAATGLILDALVRDGSIRDTQAIKQILNRNELFNKGLNTREIFKILILEHLNNSFAKNSEIFNIERMTKNILEGVAAGQILSRKLVAELGGPDKVADFVAREIVRNHVPEPIDKDNPFVFEQENSLRQFEMMIRINQWKEIIHEHTGRWVKFDAKKLMELIKKSISGGMRTLFDQDMKAAEEILTVRWGERVKWWWEMARYLVYDWLANTEIRIAKIEGKVLPKVSLYARDGAHVNAHPDNIAAQSTEIFNQYVGENKVRPILSAELAHKLELAGQARRLQLCSKLYLH